MPNDTPAPINLFDVRAQQALIRPEIDRRIAAVLDSGRFVMGPEVEELERGLAAFAGVGHCVGVSSGTDALQIAMMAEGIGRGDAVFLPAFTYTATAEVPLVVVDLDAPPELTAVRRLHLAAEAGALRGGAAPLALLLTPGNGGAPGIETRWRLAPAPGWGGASASGRWQLSRARARMAPERTWEAWLEEGNLQLAPAE